MPGLDGYETAGLIRQREQSKRTPIIFLTAINKEDAHMLRGYDAGAVDYVFKPFDPVMLRSKVTVFVDLFEKTREIQQKARSSSSLLEDSAQRQAGEAGGRAGAAQGGGAPGGDPAVAAGLLSRARGDAAIRARISSAKRWNG